MMKTLKIFLISLWVLAACFSLTGCLSHWFLESDSRLQVENGTKNYNILSLDMLGKGGAVKPWIRESLVPGERSHVIEGDWVGKFTARVRYSRLKGSDTLESIRKFDLDGGSLYLLIQESGDSLTYTFK